MRRWKKPKRKPLKVTMRRAGTKIIDYVQVSRACPSFGRQYNFSAGMSKGCTIQWTAGANIYTFHSSNVNATTYFQKISGYRPPCCSIAKHSKKEKNWSQRCCTQTLSDSTADSSKVCSKPRTFKFCPTAIILLGWYDCSSQIKSFHRKEVQRKLYQHLFYFQTEWNSDFL